MKLNVSSSDFMGGRIKSVRSEDSQSSTDVGKSVAVVDDRVRSRRALIQALLADAAQDSAHYVYSYNAGRGGE